MKRNKKLLKRRMKLMGLFFEIKRGQEIRSKTARHQLADTFGVCIHTVNNDLTKYKKTLTTDTKKDG